ncbi:MAG: hypothetical protein AAGG80_05965 [Pseudomonadota bacterium]
MEISASGLISLQAAIWCPDFGVKRKTQRVAIQSTANRENKFYIRWQKIN